MIVPGDHIVVALSGGADSVALLVILRSLMEKWDLKLTAAHLNHSIRGEKSREEAESLKILADKMRIPCIVEERNVPDYRVKKGLSLQEAAREVRYQFFLDVLKQTHADKIALGHHADDQAETVLMWLLRGASLKGLSGIPPFREGVFIRPLIDVQKEEIVMFLESSDTAYFPDTSASERHYLRNKIRHNLIPLLKKEYNPQLVKTLSRMADMLRMDNEILNGEIECTVRAIITKNQNDQSCSINAINKYPISLHGRLIRRIIYDLQGHMRGLSFKHINAVCRMLYGKGPSRVVQLPGGVRVWREYGNLVFNLCEAETAAYCYSYNSLPALVKIDTIDRKIFFRTENRGTKDFLLNSRENNVEFLSYEDVEFPLVIRNWLPGDRFYPLGLGGSKKLKDFFIDCKIPVRERQKVPVMLFKDRIAWVCGLRIDERFKLKPDYKKALKVWIK